MKKLTLVFAALAIATGFTACKKDDNNGGGGGTPAPQINCNLKSITEVTSSTGNPDEYSGFVLYYDSKDVVNKANFIDSTTGKEDSTSYALLSYSGDNLTDVKVFQNNNEFINFAMTYNAQKRVEKRFFDFPTPFGLAKIDQTYFYNSQGQIEYTIRKTEITIPQTGKVINKDSARYQNYNSFGRPEGVIVYNSVTTAQGTQPYEFEEEFKYEYDSKGNRTKISTKEDVSDPFEVIYTASFDLSKTTGEAEPAYRLLTKLFIDDWDDPNLNSSDIDLNLKISETETEDGQTTSKTLSYTYDDRGNPETSTETSTDGTTKITYTYDCK